MRDVVVVGGSIAALTAVETLRMEEFDGRITVLSDEDVPPYTRVPLSKGVLAGTESIDDIVLAPLADDVDLRLQTPATGLDLAAKTVHTPSGPVRYDGLIIATGGRARRLGTPDQAERVLRSHADCVRLRDDLAAASSVLVVGGGFLGMEIASTARTLGKDVTVVDLAPPLDRLLGAVVPYADESFNPMLEIGFGAAILREWQWRVARGEPLDNLRAFEHFVARSTGNER